MLLVIHPGELACLSTPAISCTDEFKNNPADDARLYKDGGVT
jgi:hypothetical protein